MENTLSFSERYGHYTKKIQIDSLNTTTRNLLWNALHTWIFNVAQEYTKEKAYIYDDFDRAKSFYSRIWGSFFKLKISQLPDDESNTIVLEQCEHYLDNCLWNEYYDFIEFILPAFKILKTQEGYRDSLRYFPDIVNNALRVENCPYRLVNSLIIPVTNEGELYSIEKALNDSKGIVTVHTHLLQALKLFSDKKSPDYRNSVKEAISAVESLLKIITGNSKSTLSDAVKSLRNSGTIHIHASLLNSINSLYGWAGDENGVRHAQKEESNIDSEDAQFILVLCCSIVSFFVAKSIKANLKLL